MKSTTDSLPSGDSPRYSAPALEKGLDILELLAGVPGSLPLSEIARQLGRSVSEIFRMAAALERRGYVQRDEDTGAYRLTLRLFKLAHEHPPVERLLTEGLAEMRRLAEATGLSCHLSVESEGRLMVIADAASPAPRRFSIRLGASFDLLDTASGRVLLAFCPEADRAHRLSALVEDETRQRALEARLRTIRQRGYEEGPSDTVVGLIDLSFPVRDFTGAALAALNTPYIEMKENTLDLAGVRRAVARASARIEGRLGFRPDASSDMVGA
ncbi:IclR family transcriptional regulator [Marinivivus vitaminiproducens]|uniref:IclR family transcriptional regulator n=1 Tax=Marinivivus vitaminiproducens TaxID=3035935 RepID=UPI00279B277F|nr:IclR family transcriptional regulator [Geminicoccaceae bacterium SCSIO 64248]